jgi:organic hydroperoxide reductase OsmC/OhrA
LSLHRATIRWTADGGDFSKRRYSRVHTVAFDHAIEVIGSASTSVVPKPFAIDEAVDPEAMLTASLSACHMLTFLDVAARAGFEVSAYRDEAEGKLGKMASGKIGVPRVVLHPRITFVGDKQPTPEDLARLHHQAHEGCFIANSVTTEVVVE